MRNPRHDAADADRTDRRTDREEAGREEHPRAQSARGNPAGTPEHADARDQANSAQAARLPTGTARSSPFRRHPQRREEPPPRDGVRPPLQGLPQRRPPHRRHRRRQLERLEGRNDGGARLQGRPQDARQPRHLQVEQDPTQCHAARMPRQVLRRYRELGRRRARRHEPRRPLLLVQGLSEVRRAAGRPRLHALRRRPAGVARLHIR